MTDHLSPEEEYETYESDSDEFYDDDVDDNQINASERIFRNFVYFGIIILSFVTTLSLISGASSFEVLEQFRVQFATAAFCLVTLAFVVRTNHMAWMVGLIMLAINLMPILGLAEDPGRHITLMAGDLYQGILALAQ